MAESFWLEDLQIVILTDSPVEAMDMADMANTTGHGPTLLMRKPSALAALLSEGELRPRLIILGRKLDVSEAQLMVSVCQAVGAVIVLVENAALEGVFDKALTLYRPFTLQHLQAAFGEAGLS